MRRAVAPLCVAALLACNQLLDNEPARGLLPDGGSSQGTNDAASSGDGASYEAGGCVSGAVTCAGSPDCVDLKNDPAHCGACDHACESCKDGACQPVRMGNGLDTPLLLGIDATNLFVLTNGAGLGTGTLLRAPLTRGATAGAVLTTLDRPSAMAVDPGGVSSVFLAVAAPPPPGGTSRVLAWSGTGAPTEMKTLNGSFVGALDVDGGKLWGTDLKGGRVWQASPDGSNFTATSAQAGGLTIGSIDAGGGSLVVAMHTSPCVQPGEILKWTPGSPAATTGQAIPCPSGLALAGNDVFVTNRQATPLGSVIRIDSSGSTTAVFTQEDMPSAVVANGQDLYWIDEGDGTNANGSINRAVPGTSTRVTLAGGRVHPVALAVDGSHVYWAEEGPSAATSSVWRIER